MFRDMRRKKQLLGKDEAIGILDKCTAGVLGVNGDNGYPYTVPMSYAYEDNKIFFHCAKEGHKTDSIMEDDKVTFSVIEKDEIVQESFTTHYRSVVVFGRARIIKDDNQKQHALELLVKKYSPDFIKEGLEEIKDDWDRTCLVEIQIEHMTGKVAMEIM